MKTGHKKLRLLYLHFSAPLTSGVYRKVLGFCRAMYDACQELEMHFKAVNINISENSNEDFQYKHDLNYFELRQLKSTLPGNFIKIRALLAFFRIKPAFHAAYQEIARFQPDVIILRYHMLEFPAPFNPKKIKPDVFFISEHNTKELEELSTIYDFSMLPVLLERIKARIFFRNVDAVIGVTSEIARYQIERARRNIPYFVLTNGIAVNRHSEKSYATFRGNELKMLFISSFASMWHGLDRLLAGMKTYEGNVRLELNIIGAVSPSIKDLVRSMNLGQKVIFHGFKFNKDLDAIFDSMHIGIGSLAMHRNHLKYGATLKAREYMARGIPFIISYIDEDIAEGFPLVLKLKPDDSPVEIEEVIQFTQSIYEKYSIAIPSIMRDYALREMDHKVKVKGLLDFIMQQAG